MNKPAKVKIRIDICVKGKGCVKSLYRSYSMEEHFNEKYIADGKAYAKDKLGLEPNDLAISDWPITSKSALSKIKKRYGSSNMVYGKVHNPMHSAWYGYRETLIDGISILVKSVANGHIFAIKNKQWESHP
jgi:hypothetical protein